MNLYGQDMDERISPLDGGPRVDGRPREPARFRRQGGARRVAPAAAARRARAARRRRRAARAPGRAHRAGDGEITSGTFSPTLGARSRSRGCRPRVAVGDVVEVEVRDKRLARARREAAVRAQRRDQGGLVMSDRRSARSTPADVEAYRALRLRGLAEHPEAFTSDANEEAAKPPAALARAPGAAADAPHDGVLGAFDGATLVGVVRSRRRHAREGRATRATCSAWSWPPSAPVPGVGARARSTRVIAHARAARPAPRLVLTVTAGNTAPRAASTSAPASRCAAASRARSASANALPRQALRWSCS